MRACSGKGQSNAVPKVTFDDDHDGKSRRGNVSVKTIEIVRKTNEDKHPKNITLEDFEVKAKGFVESQMCPLYRKHNPRNFMIARFDSRCPKQVTTQILSNGVDVDYGKKTQMKERYTFFAHSASQLRSRVCLLYINNPDLDKAEDIINEFGNFSKIKTAAKRAARIGLLLSTAVKTVELRKDDIFPY